MSVGLSFAILMTGTMKLNLKQQKLEQYSAITLAVLAVLFFLIGGGMEFLGILFFAIGVADGVLAFTLSQSIKREKEDYEKLQEESLE